MQLRRRCIIVVAKMKSSVTFFCRPVYRKISSKLFLVRGMRFELGLILNVLGQPLAIWLPVLMENDRDGISKACATKLYIFTEFCANLLAKFAYSLHSTARVRDITTYPFFSVYGHLSVRADAYFP